jgi:small subunit ribosomal protein S8
MHSDPIADMLTRIRNAQAVKVETVEILFSKVNVAILKLLKENNYIKDIKVDEGIKIEVFLAYKKDGQPQITHLKRISKPGQRIYVGKNKLPRVLNNYGIAIVSTSSGLMTNKQARQRGLGGEIICEIY